MVLQYPMVLGGVLTRVLECGEGDDVLVCLHGAGSRADRFRPNLPDLAGRGFHVFAVDFPGHGFAEKGPAIECSTPAFARVVDDLVDHIGGPVTLVGTSLGGHVAAWVAAHRPELVRAAVLVGAVGLVGRDPVAAGRVADTGAEGVRAKLTFLVHDPSLVTEGWVAEELAVNSSPGAAEALARVADYLRDGVPADLVGDRYAAAGIPTLLVWGTEDRWVPAEVGRRCAELLPDAPLVLLDGAGHAPYYERPAAFGEVVEDFLRRPEGRRPGERHIP